jgi:hypothetical protein
MSGDMTDAKSAGAGKTSAQTEVCQRYFSAAMETVQLLGDLMSKNRIKIGYMQAMKSS